MKSRTIFLLVLILLVVSAAFNLKYLAAKKADAPATTEIQSTKQLWTCGMHPQVIQDHPGNCPICGMKLTPLNSGTSSAATSGNATVISVDPSIIQSIGVRTAPVERRNLHRTVRANGVVAVDESREALVNLKYSGWIEKLYVDKTGEMVHKGQKLFDIYSPMLVTAMQEYLLAFRAPETVRKASLSSPEAADPVLESARNKLLNWNVTPEQISELEASGVAPRMVSVYSPANGIVLTKNVVEGGSVMEGMDLYRIADLSKVWLQAEIYEYEVPWVEVGQTAKVKLPYDPSRNFEAKVSYIYPYLNPDTRTATVRLTLPNSGLEFKPDMYADVDITTRPRDGVIAIPREAVVRSGRRDLVFIALGGGKFEPRPVEIGLEADSSLYEIRSGLNEGEQVVTSAQFLLDSETQLQEALMRLMASGGSEKDLHAAMGHAGHTSMNTGTKSESKMTDEPLVHLAEGPTMEKLYSADKLYWCPMHHEIVSADSDTHCPLCEMPLTEIPAADLKALRESDPHGCTMDPVVVRGEDKDKRCPICKMRLTPIPNQRES